MIEGRRSIVSLCISWPHLTGIGLRVRRIGVDNSVGIYFVTAELQTPLYEGKQMQRGFMEIFMEDTEILRNRILRK